MSCDILAVYPGNSLPDRLRKNQHILRIDGSTRGDVRQDYVNRFQNSRSSKKAGAAGRRAIEPVVFLVSTKAGCLGIDLSAANRVIVRWSVSFLYVYFPQKYTLNR